MMRTDRKYDHTRRQLWELAKHICNPVARRLPKGAVDHILFIENHGGKPILRAHFGCSQDHAAHTVIAADVDLMCLGNLHANVYDVPVFMNRRIELQRLRKQRSFRFSRWDDRTVDMFQHEKHSPATAFASARYSAAISLFGKAERTVLPSSSASVTRSLRFNVPMI